MAVISRTDSEIEIYTDIMDGDRVVFRRRPTGELEIMITNPSGGFRGGPMAAATVLSPAEIDALQELLLPR